MVSILFTKSKILCKFREFLFKNFKHNVWCTTRVYILIIYYYSISANAMPMAVKCNLPLYADDTCLLFQSDNARDIKK